MIFSERFPPRNIKLSPDLEPPFIAICMRDQVLKVDANEAMYLAITEGVKFGEPYGQSDISGRPGYAYRTSDIEVVLTADELYRLIRYSLEPAEFAALVERYGVFYEISDHFYDENTGYAYSPRISVRERQTFFQRCVHGEEDVANVQRYVKAWEASDRAVPLNRFLGMCARDFEAWRLRGLELSALVEAHRD